MEPMNIFIVSAGSAGALEQAAEIARRIRDAGHNARPWYEAIYPGQILLPSLIENAKKSDGAIVIFSEDDILLKDGSEIKQTRDNVLIEFGLFMGSQGLKRVLAVRVGEPQIATDLGGLIVLDRNQPTFDSKLSRWIQRLGREVEADRRRTNYEISSSLVFYDKVAGKPYDSRLTGSYRQNHRQIAFFIAEAAAQARPSNLEVLDVGGGTGKLLDMLMLSKNLSWTYLDASPRMFAFFRDEFPEVNTPILHKSMLGKLEDAYNQIERNRFDVILLSFFLSSASRRPDFQRLAASLKPGGNILVVEAFPNYSSENPWFDIEVDNHRHALKISPLSESELEAEVSAAGLKKTRDTYWVTKGSEIYSYIAWYGRK